MLMRSPPKDFRQRNETRTSIAYDCLVSCLLITKPIFSPGRTLFFPLSVYKIPFSGSRLSTACTWSKQLVQGRPSGPNQSRLLVEAISKDVTALFWG